MKRWQLTCDVEGSFLEVLIPAGSFAVEGKLEKQKFKFDSPPGAELDIKARLDFAKGRFKLDVKNVQNTDQITGATMSVRMEIGPNIGEEAGLLLEDKKNHLERKKKPKLECIAKCRGIARMEVTSDQGVLVFLPDPGKEKLQSHTDVDDGVNGAVKIHTSCSQPIDLAGGFGPYTITELIEIF